MCEKQFFMKLFCKFTPHALKLIPQDLVIQPTGCQVLLLVFIDSGSR